MNRYFSLLAFLLCFTTSFAQEKTYSIQNKKVIEQYEKAEMYFNAHTNLSARDVVKKALEAEPQFAEAWLLLANIQVALGDKTAGLEAYKKQISINPELNKFTYKSLGILEFTMGQYAEAAAHFQKLLTYPDLSDKFKRDMSKFERDAVFATEAIKNPVPFNPINLGSTINTRAPEFTPAVTADNQTIIFTRLLNRQEDFYIAKKATEQWQTAVNLSDKINTPTFNEGAQSISPDGQYLFMTICGRQDSKGRCDLYYSKLEGDQWSAPINMGEVVNSGDNDRQPAVSADGRTLYFVSDRLGGLGGEDIWSTTFLSTGKWSTPINLGPSVNTRDSEESPFIHPDNQTLYFSSDGWPGMGGKDLFYAKRTAEGDWNVPVNVGYPINNGTDERSLITTTDGQYGYISSNIAGGFGDFDIYTFELPKTIKPEPVTFVRGTVFDKLSNEKLSAKVEVINLKTNRVLYKGSSNALNGQFLTSLPGGQNYLLNVAAEGYLFYSDNFALENPNTVLKPYLLNIPLQKITVGEKVVLRNIFYKLNSAELDPESKAELDKLVAFLQTNASTRIEISGHSDNTGNEQLNNTLSQNRAKSVYDYVVKAGIDASRLTFKGYGKSQPIAPNDTEEGRALNRRTEMKIL